MEEETCHIRRTAIILTYPLRVIGYCEPIFQVSSNLTREVVTLEFILTMTNQTLLAKDCTTEIVVYLASTATEGYVMLSRRYTRLIHLLKPVRIVPRTSVHTPRLICRFSCPSSSNLITWARSTVYMILDFFQNLLLKRSRCTTVSSSIIPIACKVV